MSGLTGQKRSIPVAALESLSTHFEMRN